MKIKYEIAKYDNHIYLLSTEPIKEDDYCLEVNSAFPTGLPMILKCKQRRGNHIVLESGWQRQVSFPRSGPEILKIIATDNSKINTIKGIVVSANMKGETIFCMEHSDIGKVMSNNEIFHIVNKKDIRC